MTELAHALRLLETGDLAAARHYLETASGQDPEALRLLAKIQLAQNEPLAAVATFRRVAALRPDLPALSFETGVALLAAKDLPAAIACFRQALIETPDDAGALYNLAWALKAQGALNEAREAYRNLVARHPSDVRGWFNLGNLLQETGALDEACEAYEKALALAPNEPALLLNLGTALHGRGRLAEAEAVLTKAIAAAPDSADALGALGNVLCSQGRYAEGIQRLRQAAERAPGSAVILCNLGLALLEDGQDDAAFEILTRAAALDSPERATALSHRSLIHLKRGEPKEAEQDCRQAIAANPGHAHAHANLGRALSDCGRLEEALEAFRQAHHLAPENAAIHSNLLFALCHHPSASPEEIFAEHRRYGEIQEALAGPVRELPTPEPLAGRRLRVGYVSPDFCRHAVMLLIKDVILGHDRRRFEVFCYHTSRREDEVTAELKANIEHWRNVAGLPPDAAAELIRADRIDVLIDLAGHTAGNGLPLFARHPGRIQVTWLGYPNTTGLSRMEYRLTGEGVAPPGLPHPLNTERLVRLPVGPVFCAPPSAPPVTLPPCVTRSHVTFASLNKALKVSDEVIGVWADILTKVPSSRLLLMIAEAGTTAEVWQQRFAAHGIDPARLRFEPTRPFDAFLRLLSEVDIALDPFPYSGGSTTLVSLWMGVPVVALTGIGMRAGSSAAALRAAGLAELVASDVGVYVDIAVRLAENPAQLCELRKATRPLLLTSPMMDARAYSATLEATLEQIAHG